MVIIVHPFSSSPTVQSAECIMKIWKKHGRSWELVHDYYIYIILVSLFSMDWFKGQFTGKPKLLYGKINGFRLRCFPKKNQPIMHIITIN